MNRWVRRLAWSALGRVERWSAEHEGERLRERLGHIGDGGTLGRDLHITGASNVWLGDNVHLGRGAWIRGEGGLRVGSNTHISRNVTIFTVNHDYAGERLPYDERLAAKPVTIGENVWIGMNVSIAPGTTIGDGAIVALGACVFGDVPRLAIVGNQRWRTLGTRDAAHYDKLVAAGAYGAADGAPYRRRS